MPAKGDGGKRREQTPGKHTRNYVTQRSSVTYYTDDDTGDRVKMTTNHQKCNAEGKCDAPVNIDIQREWA